MNNYSENFNSIEDLGAIYLLLGSACNMSCRHCSQTPIKNCFNLKPCGENLSEDVINFLVKWSHSPWKYEKNNPRRLYFWGGEPLLYWDTIKKLVTLFKQKGINVSYRIYSNGLLLNNEIVEFCNKNDIYFIMSYDAPNALAARNKVPDKQKCNLFLKIKKREINTVFNAINDDMVVALDTLSKKFPDTSLGCGFMNVLSKETPTDLYFFKKNSVKKAINNLWLASNSNNKIAPYAQRWFESKIWRTQKWDRKEFDNYPYPPCHPGVVSLSINFNGDVVLCHNTNKIVAHIAEPFEKIQEKHLNEWKKLLPKKCKRCEHLDICRCICPIAIQENDELCYCHYLREFWQTIKDCYKPIKFKVKNGIKYKITVDENGDFALKEVI